MVWIVEQREKEEREGERLGILTLKTFLGREREECGKRRWAGKRGFW